MSYSAFDAARDLITGNLKLAPKQTVADRKALCDGCEVQDKRTKTCTACGCWLPAKIRLKDSSCPMELW